MGGGGGGREKDAFFTGDREMRQERGSKTGFARCC